MKRTEPLLRSFLIAGVMMLATVAVAQDDNPRIIDLPSLSIEGSTLTATVDFDASRNVYRYTYRLDVPATAKVPVRGFALDLKGRENRPQADLDLRSNYVVLYPDRQLQPNHTIPIGFQVPSPSTTRVTLNVHGELAVRFMGWNVPPGGTAGGFVVESKLPPGPRKVTIRPDDSSWDAVEMQWQGSSEDLVFRPSSTDHYLVKTETLGPYDYDASALFNGGGQSNAEVNPFLRYAYPADTRTKLTAADAKKRVIVFFGSTVDPATFTADLNGVDVRSRFMVVPGGASSVEFIFPSGTSKLKLSIEGRTSAGRTARDTDTLTFLVD